MGPALDDILVLDLTSEFYASLAGALLGDLPALLGLDHDTFNKHYVGHDFTLKACHLIRRPDMLFMFPNFGVLLEVDEHAHRAAVRESEVENGRKRPEEFLRPLVVERL